MKPQDFIFDQVYKGCLKENVIERVAKDEAIMAVDNFKHNRFKKADLLIKDHIILAKKRKIK